MRARNNNKTVFPSLHYPTNESRNKILPLRGEIWVFKVSRRVGCFDDTERWLRTLTCRNSAEKDAPRHQSTNNSDAELFDRRQFEFKKPATIDSTRGKSQRKNANSLPVLLLIPPEIGRKGTRTMERNFASLDYCVIIEIGIVSRLHLAPFPRAYSHSKCRSIMVVIRENMKHEKSWKQGWSGTRARKC